MRKALTGQDSALGASSDLPDAVKAALDALPDAVSRIPDAHLVVDDVSTLTGVRRKRGANQRVWLIRDNRFMKRWQCKISISALNASKDDGARSAEDVVIYAARKLKSLRISVIGHGGFVAIGTGGALQGTIALADGAKVVIGDKTTAMKLDINARRSQVYIGRDCMISGEVTLNSALHHGLVDLSGDSPRLFSSRTKISIGDHVWLGYNTLLVGGADVGAGAIVAAGAVVARKLAGNSVIAGNPANVRKENITWSRRPDIIDAGSVDYINGQLPDASAADTGLASAQSA